MKKRLICVVLSIIMCLSIIPLTASAAYGAYASGKTNVECFSYNGFEAFIEGDIPNGGVILGGWSSIPGVYAASNYGEQYKPKFIKKTADGSWVNLADGEKIVADGTTHYGTSLFLFNNSGNAFTENTKLIYNGTDVSGTGMITVKKLSGNFIAMYIDLGLAKKAVNVTFEANGGNFDVSSAAARAHERVSGNTLTLAKGTKIDYNYDPVIDGKYLDGWYTDAEFTNAFDVINTPIDKDITLYAKYAPLTYIENVDLSFDMFKKGTKIALQDMDIDGNLISLPMPIIEVKAPVDANYSFYEYADGLIARWLDTKDTRNLVLESFTINENTEYAIGFYVIPQKSYAFTEDTVLTINGKTCEPIDIGEDFIEVEYIFKTTKEHRLTWNMNGGSIENYKKPTEIWEDVALDLGQIKQDDIHAPTGKEFDAFEINGKKYAIGDRVIITKDSVIKLLWKNASSQKIFSDVPNGSWYHDAVYYCVENNLFAGVTDTTFAPNTGMTRAMFVTVLASQHDFNRDDYKSSSFTDVASGKWYSANVEWAYNEGLIAGVESGKFAPDQVITRAQLVTLIRTYAEHFGYDMTVGEDLDLSSYKDAKDIPAWAQNGFKWAIANNIIGGVKSGSDTLLAPGATATRATVAQIMMKLCKLPINKTVPAGEAKMTIAGNDISLYRIIVPKNRIDKVSEAASKLQNFIKTATGVNIPIFTDDNPETEYEIIVGNADREGGPETDYSKVKDATPELSFTVCVNGTKMYFTGAVDAQKRYGTLYSVYYFAEKELGFKFYQDDCIICAPKENIDFADGYEYIDGPAFERRDMYMTGGWNNCFLAGDYYHEANWVHEQGAWIDPNSTLNSAMPCLSAEANIQKLINCAIKKMQDRPECDSIWISINDSNEFCQCEQCSAAYREDATRAATIIRACNRVSAALKKEFPNRSIMVNTLGYNYTIKPTKVTKPADNVIIYYCMISNCPSHAYSDKTCPMNATAGSNVEGWGKLCTKVYVWDYSANFSYCMMPFPNFYSMRENIAWFYDNGVRGMFINATDRHCGEFNELRGYLYYKLMRNPHMSEKEFFTEMDSFITTYYGDKGLYLRKYIDIIEELTDNNHFGFNASPSIVYDYNEVYDRIDEIDALWAKAYAEAEADKTLTMRVDRAHQSWIYLRQNVLFDSMMKNGTPEQQAKYKAANEKLYENIGKYSICMNEHGGYGDVGYDPGKAPQNWK